ncbi:hypothetical protein [Asaia sp. As-1742]|uniref:hypothetical protein n=1 Tax=Asaia sp. As-1742 TaxID=2608325 RepID=UPI00141E9D99|nr:hypothetical protein [Asaia sp. As-1742]NIE80090.1 hypothetical protein [Asaia sp. As-1742]
MAVIFEGDDLVVHETDGDSDYAVITFEPAEQSQHATTTFFAEKPLRYNNIKSLGITAKSPVWYISDEVEHVIMIINDRLQGINNRIAVGYSMGGYPALNWSRRIGAKTVFSMCPKYSLDPDLCDIEQGYVDKYFCERMRGMKIDPENVSGRVFIVHDPDHTHDSYHARLIEQKLASCNATLIKSFYAQHDVHLTIQGSEKFGRMIRMLAYGSDQEIKAAYAKERKTSSSTLVTMFLRNIRFQPERALRAILSDRALKHANLKPVLERTLDMARLSHRFSEGGSFEKASFCLGLPFLEARYGREINREIVASAALRQFTRAPLGFHGHLLCYDMATKKFSGRDLFGPTPNCPEVVIRRSGGYHLMQITTGEETTYLYEQDGKVLMSDVPRDSGFTLERSARNHHHHIRSRLGYLCSHPTGHYDLDRSVKFEWEEFSIPSVF